MNDFPMRVCLNPKDVSLYLNIGKNKANELFHDISFPSFKVGSQWRVTSDDFQSWVAKQQLLAGKGLI